MERLLLKARSDWVAHVEALGLHFHTIDNNLYWNEGVCYHFQGREIAELVAASVEIEKLCMELVDHVVRHRRYAEFYIPEYCWPLIEASWKNCDKAFYGRMDFSYDGLQPPKLLEYNADTPISLLESSRVQKQWIEQVMPGAQQFNSLHEHIASVWQGFKFETLHLACREVVPWVFCDLAYLADTAIQAGFSTQLLHIEDIRWNGKVFVDNQDTTIDALFKLYPWEWLPEATFTNLLQSGTQLIEPPWKMLLSNKSLMVLLWELYPGHPNLLPAYFDHQRLSGDYVKKPLLGREGGNISLYTGEQTISSSGGYGQGEFIYQQLQLLPNFSGNYALIGSWMIGGEPAGLMIREDQSPITNAVSRFVPHFYD